MSFLFIFLYNIYACSFCCKGKIQGQSDFYLITHTLTHTCFHIATYLHHFTLHNFKGEWSQDSMLNHINFIESDTFNHYKIILLILFNTFSIIVFSLNVKLPHCINFMCICPTQLFNFFWFCCHFILNVFLI